MRYLLADRVNDSGVVADAPFPLLIVDGVLDPAAVPALERDFPRYRGAGFFPFEAGDCGPAITALVAELTAPDLADALGQRLGIERMSQFPVLVTICRTLNLRHGTIHTDSRSKIASALLYLNPAWPHAPAGCLRFLAAPDDIDAMVAPEVRPLYGVLAAFKRTDRSFHGHLPYEGERRVIQVAWLADADSLMRKTRRGRLSRAIKWMAGRLDRWFGSERGRNAAHLD